MITTLMLLIFSPGAVSSAWSVTYENPDICSLKGSSVVFRCSYNYTSGESVHKTVWYKGKLKDNSWTRVELSSLPSYHNRSQYLGDTKHNCSLAIHDLQDGDTGYYYFRFDTETYGWHSKDSIHLAVTELSVRVRPATVRAGENVMLECVTSCQLPGTVLFKDGQPVTKTVFQAKMEDAGNYVCAVIGQESVLSYPETLDVQYPPLNVSVEMSYLGQLMLNSGVNLTCSSAANPAVYSYTWYKGAASSFNNMIQVGSGQVLSIPSVEAFHTGLYFCNARNHLGGKNSSEVLLTVEETDMNSFILHVCLGVKVVIVMLLTAVVIWVWRHGCNSAVDKENNSNGPDCVHDYENFISAYMGPQIMEN